MPIHWDWDWDRDWHHDHLWHWPSRLAWPWDSFSYHAKCPTRRWKSTQLTDYDVDVCTRDWHLHHMDDGPWCHRSCLASRVSIETGDEPDSNGKGTFKVIIDVHHFRGDELQLKVRNNDTVLLSGKQKDDRGEKSAFCITREFTRKYKLPRNYDATLAKATLSTDGILTIVVPAPPPPDDAERLIEIEPTGAYFGSVSGGKNTAAKAIENGDDAAAERKKNDADADANANADNDGDADADKAQKKKKARINSQGDSQ